MDERLKQAYNLLKQGKRRPAMTLIMQVIQQDQECADAWALLAAAHQDMDRRKTAINRALAIDPDHRAAQRLRQHLHEAPDIPVPPPIDDTPSAHSVIVPLKKKKKKRSGEAAPPPDDTPTGAPPHIFESSEGDPWHDAWNNSKSTILGMGLIIVAASLPFLRYLNTHDRVPGLMTLILVVSFGIAAVRGVIGKHIDGRAILPVSVFTLAMWVLMVADLRVSGTGNVEHAILVITVVYGVVVLGWVTAMMPFGPRLRQALLHEFESWVTYKGWIELGETKQDTLTVDKRRLSVDVYYYRGQAGDEIYPEINEEENLSPIIRPFTYAWVTLFGLWGSLVRLNLITGNLLRLPYTGVYVIAVGVFHPEIESKARVTLRQMGYWPYRLEMKGKRHSAQETTTFMSQLSFALQVYLGKRFMRKLDPDFFFEDLFD